MMNSFEKEDKRNNALSVLRMEAIQGNIIEVSYKKNTEGTYDGKIVSECVIDGENKIVSFNFKTTLAGIYGDLVWDFEDDKSVIFTMTMEE